MNWKLSAAVFSFVFFTDCSTVVKKSSVPENDSDSVVSNADDPDLDDIGTSDTSTCEDLSKTKTIMNFADLAQQDVGLLDIDSSNWFSVKGHFVDPKNFQTLVWVQAYGLPSSGDRSNLMMLFSCRNLAKRIFTTTGGVFTKKEVRDLDGDGIQDIIAESSIERMGEYHEAFEIFNFRDTILNSLYVAQDYSYTDDMFDDAADYWKKGDTLSVYFTHQLIDPDKNGVYEVKQIRKVNTYNGGKRKVEIERRQVVHIDTCIIPLKKIN